MIARNPTFWQRLKYAIFGAGLGQPAEWFSQILRGDVGETASGVVVNGRNALTYSTVWQCTNVICNDVKNLPLNRYRRTGEKSRDLDRQSNAYRLTRRRWNPNLSAGQGKRLLTYHALHWGNGYAGIVRNGRGDPLELVPLLPDRTEPVERDDGSIVYEHRPKPTGDVLVIQPRDMLHIHGLGWDGTKGYSVIRLARDSWGLGLAQERHGAAFFKNNARPGGYIEAQPGTQPDVAKQMRKDWNDVHQGTDNAHVMGVLINAKFHEIGIPNEDAQWIESRQFQRSEIASWFGLAPHKANDFTNAHFTNLEESNRDYLNSSLMSWLTTWEEECNEKLLSEREKQADSHFYEFNTASLLRGTTKERYEAYSIGISSTWLSPNEVRAMENMNPRDGGDEFGNPNTTPGTPSDDSGDDPPPDEQGQNENRMARAIMESNLRRVLRNEARKMEHFAKTSKNFVKSVDGFYDRFPVTLLETIEGAGGTAEDAQGHAEASRERIMDVAGEATADTLLELVCREVAAWPDRAESLVDTLMERINETKQQAV